MTPIVDGLKQEYGGQIVVQRINAEQGDGPAIMREYGILGHPTLLIFDSQGQEVQRLIGPQSAQGIEVLLQEELNVQR
jgi:thiol-disulfide isomerase/thioredoxin